MHQLTNYMDYKQPNGYLYFPVKTSILVVAVAVYDSGCHEYHMLSNIIFVLKPMLASVLNVGFGRILGLWVIYLAPKALSSFIHSLIRKGI